jgi:hypothetical protein
MFNGLRNADDTLRLKVRDYLGTQIEVEGTRKKCD